MGQDQSLCLLGSTFWCEIVPAKINFKNLLSWKTQFSVGAVHIGGIHKSPLNKSSQTKMNLSRSKMYSIKTIYNLHNFLTDS